MTLLSLIYRRVQSLLPMFLALAMVGEKFRLEAKQVLLLCGHRDLSKAPAL